MFAPKVTKSKTQPAMRSESGRGREAAKPAVEDAVEPDFELAAIKGQIKSDIAALGDVEENLVRMQAKANSAEAKWNKSWHDLTYEQVAPYGYKPADLDRMRSLEDAALESIKKRIADLTSKYSAKIPH